ncbi:MAG: hypothetical protein U0354_06090 [Candidatus Sericytochromatia bacterium]
MIKVIHNLEERNSLFNQLAVKVNTFNSDGSKTETTETTSDYKDGKKKIIRESRTLDSNGYGTGTGIITITSSEGVVSTYNIVLNIDSTGTTTTKSLNYSKFRDFL